MTTTDLGPQTRILNSLPDEVQFSILAYSREAELTAQSVIELVIARFLEVNVSLLESRQSSIENTDLLAELPLFLESRVREYAEDTEVPPEFVVELAIAHFLDPDSVTFDDCRIRVQGDLVEWLKQQHKIQATTAA